MLTQVHLFNLIPYIQNDNAAVCNWFSFERSQKLCLAFHNCTTLATDSCVDGEDCVSGMQR